MGVKHLSFTVIEVKKAWSFTSESTLLSQVTFCVVDLETTGSSSAAGGITEIGAVKYRGGEEVSRFSTLINPGQPIPANIVMLTGISSSMVADAPRVEDVLDMRPISRPVVSLAQDRPELIRKVLIRDPVAVANFANPDGLQDASRAQLLLHNFLVEVGWASRSLVVRFDATHVLGHRVIDHEDELG